MKLRIFKALKTIITPFIIGKLSVKLIKKTTLKSIVVLARIRRYRLGPRVLHWSPDQGRWQPLWGCSIGSLLLNLWGWLGS